MLSRLLFLGFAMLLSWSVQAQLPCVPGEIFLAPGQDASFCDDGSGGPFFIRFRSQPAGLPRAYVVVNDADEIVYIGYSGNIDFTDLGTGLRVYAFSLIGSITAQVGDNINDGDLASGCSALSTNFIEITMDNAGQLGGTLTGGPFDFCVGNFVPDMIPEGAITLNGEVGDNFSWVITDSDGNILGLPASPFDVNFDFSGPGACQIYNISYLDGLQGLEMGMNIADLAGCFELSNAVVVNRTQPRAGVILGGPFSFCVGDGTPDMIPDGGINIVGGAGENFFWIVTDSDDNIIGLPPSPYVVDFDGAGQGTCYIRRIATFDDAIVGLELNNNLDDLEGCFNFSNRVTVNRTSTEGGVLEGGPFTFCVGDGIADMIAEDEITFSGNSGANSQWVVTDSNGNILGLPPTFSVVDFDGAGAGACLVYHLSYEDGIEGLVTEANIADLIGCFGLSNPVTVNRNQPNGGTLEGGPFYFCVSDGVIDMISEDEITLAGETGPLTQWVVTDAGGMILGLPPSFAAVDFDGAGPGACLIYHLSYIDGLNGLAVDQSINDLDGCFGLSNSIVVNRTEITASTLVGGPFDFCVGNIQPDLIPEGAITLTPGDSDNMQWVVTDSNGNILGLPPSPFVVNFDFAGPGACLVYHLNYSDGLTGLAVDMNIADLDGCFALSNAVVVNRTQPRSGVILGGPFTFCAGDGVPDMIPDGGINIVGGAGENFFWIVTDGDDNIIGLPPSPYVVDFDGAGVGTCYIRRIGTFEDAVVGLELNNNLDDLEGCFNFSNRVTVNRSSAEGGALEGGPFTFCAGDGVADMIGEDEITLSGADGANMQWVVTDANGNILGLPPTFSVVDFDGAGAGACIVYHLSYEDGLEGLDGGLNVADLVGCFDLSNGIVVNRNQPEGGTISTETGNLFNRVVVANRASGTISVIDSDTNELLDTYDMPDDGEPMYVVYNSTNQTVLVGDYTGKVVAFDALDFSVTGQADAGNGVFHMWISPNNEQLWVNNELDRTISVINPGTMETIATVQLPTDLFDAGYKPHDVIIMPDNSAAFVTLLGAGDEDYVIKYDASTFTETGRAAVGSDPHVSLTSANDKLYVASQGSGEVKVLNRSDLSEVTTVTVPNAHGLGMNADGTFLYIGNISEGGVNATYTLDLSTNMLSGGPVDAPFSAPHNYAVTSDNAQLFVTHSGGANNQVSVYSLAPTPTLATTITVESNPFGLAAYTYVETTTELTICAGDGISDAFDVTLVGNSGSNSQWVITDSDSNILGLPMAPPFDLDGAGAGSCIIYHLSHADGLAGLEMGMNLSNLEGCFDLSNGITVNRNQPEGGTLEGGPFTFCAGDGNPDMIGEDEITLSGESGPNTQWIVTDANGNILGLPPTFSVVDFDGAGAGACTVYHLSYEDGLEGLEADLNIADFAGCFDLSNGIVVNRNQPAAGTLEGGPFSFCVSNNVADMIDDGAITLTGNSGPNAQWVVTDSNGNILGLPPTYSVVDFDGAGGGACLIYHLSYVDGLDGLAVDMNVDNLEGCFSLSNAITVNRTAINGGAVTTTNGETSIDITVNDGIADVIEFMSTGAIGESFTYVITDSNNEILGIPEGNSNDFEGAGVGVCRVWGLSYTGALLLEAGDVVGQVQVSEGCSAISDIFITVNRTEGIQPNVPGTSQQATTLDILEVQLYPNPAVDQLQLNLTNRSTGQVTDLEVMIVQMDGKVVYRNTIGAGELNSTVDISRLAAGTYFLRINDGSQIVTKRFVKAE